MFWIWVRKYRTIKGDSRIVGQQMLKFLE
jgi:hypothetical protein